MEISLQILKELCEDAGTQRELKAKEYSNTGKVEIININYIDPKNFEVKANVYGNEIYTTYISAKKGEIDDISCTCPDYEKHYSVCKHTLATTFALENMNTKQNYKKNVRKEAKYKNFRQIVTNFYNEEVEEINKEEIIIKNKESINIEPYLIYDKFTNDIKVEFKIGDKRMYKIKDLSEFYERMLKNSFYRYGDKLQFMHVKEVFTKESQELLEFILKYAEIIKYANSNSNSQYRYYGKAL